MGEQARRVLVVAPTAKDAANSRGLFAEAGVPYAILPDVAAVCRALEAGDGAVLLTQESLAGDAAARPTAGGRRLRVLVVEDNPDAADGLRALLTFFGYEVSVAGSGPEGVAAAKREASDAVLCDIGLPGMDGYAVADAIRKNGRASGARLIAVTAYGREADLRRALQAGFDAHLTKPVDPEKLLGQLESAAGR